MHVRVHQFVCVYGAKGTGVCVCVCVYDVSMCVCVCVTSALFPLQLLSNKL